MSLNSLPAYALVHSSLVDATPLHVCNNLTITWKNKKKEDGLCTRTGRWKALGGRSKIAISEANDIKCQRITNKIRPISIAKGDRSSKASIQIAGRSKHIY